MDWIVAQKEEYSAGDSCSCCTCNLHMSLGPGLNRARESLNEAAALRDRFTLGTNISRRVAAAATSAAEAAAAADESSFRPFMVAVQQCGSSVAIVQQETEVIAEQIEVAERSLHQNSDTEFVSELL